MAPHRGARGRRSGSARRERQGMDVRDWMKAGRNAVDRIAAGGVSIRPAREEQEPCPAPDGERRERAARKEREREERRARRERQRQEKRERKEQDRELRFTVLGPSGSGKTTLLASMYREIEDRHPGVLQPLSDRQNKEMFQRLERIYERLEDAAEEAEEQAAERSWGYFDASYPTGALERYAFHIASRRETPVVFFDHPGAWLAPGDEGHGRLVELVRRSSAVLVAIDTSSLMEGTREDGYPREADAGIGEIAQVLKEGLEDGGQDKLIVLALLKCEKYAGNAGRIKRMLRRMEEALDEILRLERNVLYEGRLAIALLPVQTIGGLLAPAPGRREAERRLLALRGFKFYPKDVDQPMRYILSFLMAQIDKRGGAMGLRRAWERLVLARTDELAASARAIRREMRMEDDPAFRIAGNRELIIGPAPGPRGVSGRPQ